ncbi:hypothetical protein [Acidovorax temperans]|uniref:hypothetical protein n=1 Tax=Acidovorax temperans TaxID=80878 RepID=UPI0035AE6C54
MEQNLNTSAVQNLELDDACVELQKELDALLGSNQDSEKAANSLDNAIASIKEVERRNVSTVQLVAL